MVLVVEIRKSSAQIDVHSKVYISFLSMAYNRV